MEPSERTVSTEDAGEDAVRIRVTGPTSHLPEVFQGFEDYHHPWIWDLRNTYSIDRLLKGERNEFRKILKLRHWVHTRWLLDKSQNRGGDALSILRRAEQGTSFCCGHSMVVLQAVLSCFGYVARNLGIERDHRAGAGSHHGVNEVWSNDFCKWVALDATYDVHFERDGVPLSALELHEAVRSGQTGDIVKVRGLSSRPCPMEEGFAEEATVRTYWWIAYHLRMDPFTHPYWRGGNRLAVFDNGAFRKGTWYRQRGGRRVKHWAYDADAFVRVSDRYQIEWTPGVPDLSLSRQSEHILTVVLRSATPNLKCYRVRVDGGRWRSISGESVRWRRKTGASRMEVRTRNLFGVDGPPVVATGDLPDTE